MSSEQGIESSYAYNGLGDRLQQTVDGATMTYNLDLNAGLTQVLADGSNTYLYGLSRIAQSPILNQQSAITYFLDDALGSVRQMTDAAGKVTFTQSYDPYGEVLSAAGEAKTSYGYTGEYTDPTGMVYLRARYYSPWQGRFMTRDTWGGNAKQPTSYDKWLYGLDNPLGYIDPSGMITEQQSDEADKIVDSLYSHYNVQIQKDWGYRVIPSASYLLPGIDVGCYWEEGNWNSLRELRLVKQAVVKIARKLGGDDKFRAAMGRVRITRLKGAAGDVPMSLPRMSSDFLGDLRLPDAFFDQSDDWDRYIITHELGHRWDFQSNFRLSLGLMKALGTWICDQNGNNCRWEPYARHLDPISLKAVWERPAGVQLTCNGDPPLDCPEPYALTYGLSGIQPWESIFQYYGMLPGIDDWAESFANYIDPSYYRSQSLSRLVPGGVRETYVRYQINSLP